MAGRTPLVGLLALEPAQHGILQLFAARPGRLNPVERTAFFACHFHASPTARLREPPCTVVGREPAAGKSANGLLYNGRGGDRLSNRVR